MARRPSQVFVLGLVFAAVGALAHCGSSVRANGLFGTEDAGGATQTGDSQETPGLLVPDASSDDAGASSALRCKIATVGGPGAFPSDLFSSWLDTAGVKGTTSLGDQTLTSTLLEPYKMIVVLNVTKSHPYTPEEASVLSDWVNEGGGLLTLTGYTGPPEPVNVNRLLLPFGMAYDSFLVLYNGEENTWPINAWNPHPVTQGITSIGFGYGYPVKGAGSVLAVGTQNNVSYEVLRAAEVGKGHVLAWGDEWIVFNDQWSSHPEYQVQKFWQNIVDWLNPNSGCTVPVPK